MRTSSFLVVTVVVLLSLHTAHALQRPKVAIGYVSRQEAPCEAGSVDLSGKKLNGWTSPHWELGFMHLKSAERFDIKPLAGKLVMAIGTVDEDYAPQTPKPCNKKDLTWRRDALPGKHGPRVMNDRMGPLAHVGGFIVEQAAVIDPLKAARDGKQVRVTFTSPVENALPYITLWGAYEACDKSGARKLKSEAFKQVAPHGVLNADFPAIMQSGKDRHVLTTIWVTTDDDDVMFDLAWPLPAGLVTCEAG